MLREHTNAAHARLILLAPAVLTWAACTPPAGLDGAGVAGGGARLAAADAESVTRPSAEGRGGTEPVIFHARDAKVHGRNARYEVGGGKDNIGHWSNAADWVSWDIDLPNGGGFLVYTTYACPNNEAGSTYAVALRPAQEEKGDELRGVVEPTGSWTMFVTERLGVLQADAPGRYTLAVTPLTKARGAVMNLQAITLKPGLWEKGLVVWWRFDEGEGERTADAAGQDALLASLAPDPPLYEDVAPVGESQGSRPVVRDALTGAEDEVRFARWRPGVSKTALRLDGITTSVTRSAEDAPRLDRSFSIEAWVKLCAPADGWCPIVNRHQYPLGFFFGLDGAGDLGLHLSVGGKWKACTSSVRLPARRWTHVAATFDEERGIAVYLDGEETGRLEAAGETAPAGDVDLVLGRHNHLPWSFDGMLDEVKLFNRALSPEDVGKHYEAGKAGFEPPPMITINDVLPDRGSVFVCERVTLEVDLEATYDNPFDPSEVAVEAVVITPSLETMRVPGFLYRAFERRLVEVPEEPYEGDAAEDDYWAEDAEPKMVIKELIEPTGAPRWLVRLSFPKPGRYLARVTARDVTGEVTSDPITILVLPADVPGLVRRHETDRRYFVTERGENFFPTGANVCWGGPRGTFNYDEWLPRYAYEGCNFFRVWLSPPWTTFAMNTAESGFDGIDLGNAWRLDHVLETAEVLDMKVMLCIDSFNILRSNLLLYGLYEDAPYARAQGGPTLRPSEYFTHPRSLRAYRNRLRYLVARYGWSSAVFAWEFWNEVDITDEYDPKIVAAWHAEMADLLRDLDPWRHLITTSYAAPKGDPAVTGLPGMDLVQTHSYGGNDMARELGNRSKAREIPKDRPHFFGEFGILASGDETAKRDPSGIHLHNGLYSSVGQGRAGTPMTWWWDSYVHEKDLYSIFGAFARWVEGFDFVAQKARRAKISILCEKPVDVRPGFLAPVLGTWEKATFNRGLNVRVDRKGLATFTITPSENLHGQGFHRGLHNPVTFELDAPEPAIFGVRVKGVSGYGDGNLRIEVDRKLVLKERFPVPEGNEKEVLTQYNEVYEVEVPAGRHRVRVANTGKDWISVAAYHIPWLEAAKIGDDRLRAWGVVGDRMALVWIQNRDYTWSNATRGDYEPRSVRDATATVHGLAPGRWTVEHWDTWEGRVTKTEEATAGEDGDLTLELPDVAEDAAFRLRRQGPEEPRPSE
ncbi:MAG: LamG-like jellyroll fold domain-containing protein [Planctomycetota bacterium]